MINAVVIEEAHVLVPNKEHQNFTRTREILPVGEKIVGSFKSIKGKRRGEDFSYRVFITNNGEIIYSNKIKEEMKPTAKGRCNTIAAVGAGLGYLAVYCFDKTKSVTVTQSR